MGRDTLHRLLRDPANLALNSARDVSSTASLDKLFLWLITLTVKIFFLILNLNLQSLSLKAFPLVLSLHALVKKSLSSSLVTSLYVPVGTIKFSQSLHFSVQSNANSLFCFTGEVLQPPAYLHGYSLHLVQQAHMLLMLEIPRWTHYSR